MRLLWSSCDPIRVIRRSKKGLSFIPSNISKSNVLNTKGIATEISAVNTIESSKNEKKSTNSSIKLLRIPRSTIPTSFYIPNETRQRVFYFPLFRLILKSLSPSIIQQINDGPTWLQGEYPLGLLEKRHEVRRFLDPNVERRSGWRDIEGDVEGETGKALAKDVSYKQSALIKRPLLAIGKRENLSKEQTPLHTYIPVLVITPKKSIDKRAVIRNKVKTKLLYAFEKALLSILPNQNSISWPLTDNKGLPFAMVFFPSKEILSTPMSDLIESNKVLLTKVIQRHSQQDLTSKSSSPKKNHPLQKQSIRSKSDQRLNPSQNSRKE